MQLKPTHIHLFFLGWVYYILTPIALGYFGIYNSVPSFELMDQYYDNQNPYFFYYFFYSLAIPVFFWIGSTWRKPSFKKQCSVTIIDSGKYLGARMLLAIYALLFVFYAVQAAPLIGGGYMTESDLSILGPMATLQMLILYQYLYERATGKRTANEFAALLALNSLLLLSMGGRLYVLSAIVAIYFRWWNWEASSRASQMRSFTAIFMVPIVLVGLGMWRVGDSDYKLVGFYLFSESIFTNISSLTLFSGGRWSGFFEVPNEFFAGFANIVPSMFWPGKAEWLAIIVDSNMNFQTPFGAVSIIASTVGNFGYIGGLLFFLFVGIYMSTISIIKGNFARQAYYCYLVGFLPFMFFRDPFQVQIKVVITGFLLYLLTSLLNRYGSKLK